MIGNINLLVFGMMFLFGMALTHQPSNQQDMEAMHKNRRIAIVNELIKAQDQIQTALKRMYKAVGPPGNEHSPGGEDDCSEESNEIRPNSGEEDAFDRMKQQQIQDARKQIHEYTHQLASQMLEVDKSIEKITRKVDKEIKDSKTEVNYTLFYNKPARPGAHHGSHEERPEHGHKGRNVRPQRSMVSRSPRQLGEHGSEGAAEEGQTVDVGDGEDVPAVIVENVQS
ncbi:uncharacterized protein LOC134208908 [Armigeres subalbatus]|uniref:uncharacterized protein LOC134208908 n=1 Tax=Armigeres subalbatus TaxID=124917 RepID=UPI002ED4D570